MTFEVDVNGRVHVVSIESVDPTDATGGRYHVTAGASEDLDIRRTPYGLSIVRTETAEIVDAAIVERAASEYLVQIRGVSLTAVVDGRRSRRQQGSGAEGSGEQRLLAPMPGRIVRVLVRAGDDVIARQGLVVIEAMKMENELGAVRAGRVVEIAVSEGASVEAGRLLVRIE
jgi:biotin carboxyl carrier protein